MRPYSTSAGLRCAHAAPTWPSFVTLPDLMISDIELAEQQFVCRAASTCCISSHLADRASLMRATSQPLRRPERHRIVGPKPHRPRPRCSIGPTELAARRRSGSDVGMTPLSTRRRRGTSVVVHALLSSVTDLEPDPARARHQRRPAARRRAPARARGAPARAASSASATRASRRPSSSRSSCSCASRATRSSRACTPSRTGTAACACARS